MPWARETTTSIHRIKTGQHQIQSESRTNNFSAKRQPADYARTASQEWDTSKVPENKDLMPDPPMRLAQVQLAYL